MAKLSIDAAAFHGFGFVRRDPLTFLGVTVLLAAFGLALAVIMVPAYARFFDLMMEIDTTGAEPDPEALFGAMFGFFGAVMPLYLLIIPINMIVYGALYRSLIFGKSKGWVLGLQLGLDELRVFIVMFICGLLVCIPYFATIFLVLLLGGVAAAIAGAAGGESAAAVVLIPVIVIGYIVGIAATIWVAIRLCYAAPATIGEKRFVIFDSWKMTKGSFWTLFLAYLIVFVLIWIAEMVIFGIVAVAASGWIASFDPETFDFSAFENIQIGPAVIIGAVLFGVLATFVSGVFLGVSSRGYLAWKEDTPSVFSESKA